QRALSERIRGEEPVASRVPVRGEARVGRIVENRQRDRLRIHGAAEQRPSSARAPHRVTLQPFAADVLTGDAGVVDRRRLRRLAVRVAVGGRWLLGRLLQAAGDAYAERALFVVLEQDALIERGQRRDAIDR